MRIHRLALALAASAMLCAGGAREPHADEEQKRRERSDTERHAGHLR